MFGFKDPLDQISGAPVCVILYLDILDYSTTSSLYHHNWSREIHMILLIIITSKDQRKAFTLFRLCKNNPYSSVGYVIINVLDYAVIINKKTNRFLLTLERTED